LGGSIKGHQDDIRTINTSLDGKHILTAGEDHSIILWELLSGKQLCKLEGHTLDVSQAIFHPTDNNLVLSSSKDKTIRMWKIELA
jgi:WD40 repeat protein